MPSTKPPRLSRASTKEVISCYQPLQTWNITRRDGSTSGQEGKIGATQLDNRWEQRSAENWRHMDRVYRKLCRSTSIAHGYCGSFRIRKGFCDDPDVLDNFANCLTGLLT